MLERFLKKNIRNIYFRDILKEICIFKNKNQGETPRFFFLWYLYSLLG